MIKRNQQQRQAAFLKTNSIQFLVVDSDQHVFKDADVITMNLFKKKIKNPSYESACQRLSLETRGFIWLDMRLLVSVTQRQCKCFVTAFIATSLEGKTTTDKWWIQWMQVSVSRIPWSSNGLSCSSCSIWPAETYLTVTMRIISASSPHDKVTSSSSSSSSSLSWLPSILQ